MSSQVCYFGNKISNRIAKTPEGFLICQDVPISRTGYQRYLASEIYDSPKNERKIIHIYRPEKEVFDPKSMASFEGKPVTNEHPDEDINPENYHKYSCGHVQNVHQGEGEDSNKVLADLYITDPLLIKLIQNGKREISCGYYAEDVKDGEGRICQSRIRGNHVAVVDNGRAGKKVCIRDKNPFTRSKRKMRKYYYDDDILEDDDEILEDEDILEDDDEMLEDDEEMLEDDEDVLMDEDILEDDDEILEDDDELLEDEDEILEDDDELLEDDDDVLMDEDILEDENFHQDFGVKGMKKGIRKAVEKVQGAGRHIKNVGSAIRHATPIGALAGGGGLAGAALAIHNRNNPDSKLAHATTAVKNLPKNLLKTAKSGGPLGLIGGGAIKGAKAAGKKIGGAIWNRIKSDDSWYYDDDDVMLDEDILEDDDELLEDDDEVLMDEDILMDDDELLEDEDEILEDDDEMLEDDDELLEDEDEILEDDEEDLNEKANNILDDARMLIRDMKRKVRRIGSGRRSDAIILNDDDLNSEDVIEDDDEMLEDDDEVIDETVIEDDDEMLEDDDELLEDEDEVIEDDDEMLEDDDEMLEDDDEVCDSDNEVCDSDETEVIDADKTKALRDIAEASRAITDPRERKQLQDAIYKSLCGGKNQMSDIMRITKKNRYARMDSAPSTDKVDISNQQAIYDSFNPHKRSAF